MNKLIALIIAALSILASTKASEYVWPFSTDQNPTLSETANPNAATIETGPFSIGWVSALPFSTNQGFWDLGSAGTVTASFVDDSTRAVVETVEWYDGAIFGQFASVSITGGAFLSESFDIYETWPVVGNWVKHTQEFSLSSAVWSLTLTGSTNGTVLGNLGVKAYRPEQVFGLWVESSSSMNGPWTSFPRPLMLVTNQPGSLFYRVNIKP